MLIAIPAVIRYIDKSKKETFIKEINSLVDTVRYGIASDDPVYSMNGQTIRIFDLKNIELEKGENTIIKGTLTVNTTDNSYKVKVTEERNDNCLAEIDISKISKDNIVSCGDLNRIDYPISVGEYQDKVVSFNGTNWTYTNKTSSTGSNWYVIKESRVADDYVVLMKEKILYGNELIDDVTGKNYASDDNQEKMTWYISDTCHYKGDYDDGRTKKHGDTKTSGCTNNNRYENSRIKYFLENVYAKKIGEDNLSVDENGVKIRLITLEELENNLGWDNLSSIPRYSYPQYPPRWVYKGFDYSNTTCCYYTMSFNSNNGDVSVVHNDSGSIQNYPCGYSYGVRPVINLKKSAIE